MHAEEADCGSQQPAGYAAVKGVHGNTTGNTDGLDWWHRKERTGTAGDRKRDNMHWGGQTCERGSPVSGSRNWIAIMRWLYEALKILKTSFRGVWSEISRTCDMPLHGSTPGG